MISWLFLPRGKVGLQHLNGGGMIFDFGNKHEISMYFNLFAPELSGVIKSVLRRGDIFVDCGANVGYFTFFSASFVAPSGCVLAIDANPFCVGRVKESKRFGNYANVKVIEGAVGEKEGEILFNVADDAMYSSVSDLNQLDFAKTSKTINVPVYTLDSIWNQYLAGLGKRIRLLKVDVEGAEIDVLRGMPFALKEKRIEYIYLEVHKKQIELRGQEYTDLFGILGGSGYAVEKRFGDYAYLYGLRR